MSSQTDPRLEQAKRLIQEKQRDAARAMLVDIIRADNENVEALYLYAHVARSRPESENILQRVLQLDPLHYRARAALNKFRQRSIEQLPERDSAMPSTANRVARMLWIAAGLMLIVIIGGAVAVFSLSDDDSSSSSASNTQVTQASGVTPTGTNTPASTVVQVGLPATWTPAPTTTVGPTRTSAPTMTLHPTNTLPPTFTPTAVEIALTRFAE